MNLKIPDYVFVLIQFSLFIIYMLDIELVTIHWFSSIRLLGLFIFVFGILIVLISLLQLNKNLSPFPSPKSNAELIKNGLYKYVRHPIYTGIICMGFGYGFYTSSFFKLTVSIIMYILFYFKARYEEEKLLEFYKDYYDYKRSTGRFLPKSFSFFRR